MINPVLGCNSVYEHLYKIEILPADPSTLETFFIKVCLVTSMITY